MRSYIRHPSDIPIQIDADSKKTVVIGRAEGQQLSNVSHGGLAFNAPRAFATGSVIILKINVVQPAFEARGLVTHCAQEDGHYVIGIEFLSKDSLFVARMVEQICHIEHYKREVAETEGRELSGEQAAKEWIERYADSFPQWQANS